MLGFAFPLACGLAGVAGVAGYFRASAVAAAGPAVPCGFGVVGLGSCCCGCTPKNLSKKLWKGLKNGFGVLVATGGAGEEAVGGGESPLFGCTTLWGASGSLPAVDVVGRGGWVRGGWVRGGGGRKPK